MMDRRTFIGSLASGVLAAPLGGVSEEREGQPSRLLGHTPYVKRWCPLLNSVGVPVADQSAIVRQHGLTVHN
jgi:hypothetical protein